MILTNVSWPEYWEKWVVASYMKHDKLHLVLVAIVVWIPNGAVLLMLPEAISTSHRGARI